MKVVKNKNIVKFLGKSYRQNLAMFTIVFGLVCLSVYSTYGLYMKSIVLSNTQNVNTVNTYDVGILAGNIFDVLPGDEKKVNFKIKSNNNSAIKYQLYYTVTSGTATNLVVSQLVNNNNDSLITSGTLLAGQNINVPLYLINNGDANVSLFIDVKYYFIEETLSLDSNQIGIINKRVR